VNGGGAVGCCCGAVLGVEEGSGGEVVAEGSRGEVNLEPERRGVVAEGSRGDERWLGR
jgi:hypothetical protein